MPITVSRDNFNDTLPEAKIGHRNVEWQADLPNVAVRNISACFLNIGDVSPRTSPTEIIGKADQGKLVKFVSAVPVACTIGTNGTIVTAGVNNGGTGYAVNDVVNVGGAGTGATLKILAVGGGGVVTSFIIFVPGQNYVPATGVTTSYGGAGTGFTVDVFSVERDILDEEIVFLQNNGSAAVTVTPGTGADINGNANVVLTSGQGIILFWDGVNFQSMSGLLSTPGGSNTQVQFNSSGAFGGITGATSDGTNLFVTTQAAGDNSTKAASTAYVDVSFATKAGVQKESYSYGTDTGAANAYAVALSPAVTSYVAGQDVAFIATHSNTTASTVALNGLSTKAIKKWSAGSLVDVAAGDITANQLIFLKYDGTVFQIPSPDVLAFATKIGVQQESYSYGTDTGAANAYAVALTPAVTSYVAGQDAAFIATHTNTTASTLALNGLATKNIKKWSSGSLVALAAGDITVNQLIILKYDGTQFIMPTGGGGGTTSPLTTKGDIYTYSTVNDRLPVGSNGQFLTADSTQSTGLKWVNEPFDVLFSPNVVLGSGTIYDVAVFARTVLFAANFAGAVGHCRINPGSTQTININKNGSQVGTISITSGGVFTFSSTGGTSVTYNSGDYLTLTNQAGADTGMLLQCTFAGTR